MSQVQICTTIDAKILKTFKNLVQNRKKTQKIELQKAMIDWIEKHKPGVKA